MRYISQHKSAEQHTIAEKHHAKAGKSRIAAKKQLEVVYVKLL
jgi:hypothetical protein